MSQHYCFLCFVSVTKIACLRIKIIPNWVSVKTSPDAGSVKLSECASVTATNPVHCFSFLLRGLQNILLLKGRNNVSAFVIKKKKRCQFFEIPFGKQWHAQLKRSLAGCIGRTVRSQLTFC